MKALQINYIRTGLYTSTEMQIKLLISSISTLNSEFSTANHLFGVLQAQLNSTSSFELVELCTCTVNGCLDLKEKIIQHNPTWPLTDWKEEGRADAKGNLWVLLTPRHRKQSNFQQIWKSHLFYFAGRSPSHLRCQNTCWEHFNWNWHVDLEEAANSHCI